MCHVWEWDGFCFNLTPLILLDRWFGRKYVYITLGKQPYMDTGNGQCLHRVHVNLASVRFITEHERFSGADTETLVSMPFCFHWNPLPPARTPFGCKLSTPPSHCCSPICWAVVIWMNGSLSSLLIITELSQTRQTGWAESGDVDCFVVIGSSSFLTERCPVSAVWTGTPTFFYNKLHKDRLFYLQRYRLLKRWRLSFCFCNWWPFFCEMPSSPRGGRQGSKEGAGLASSVRHSMENVVVEATHLRDFECTAKRSGWFGRLECKCVWRDPFTESEAVPPQFWFFA